MQHDNQDSVPTLATVSEGFAQWRASGDTRTELPLAFPQHDNDAVFVADGER